MTNFKSKLCLALLTSSLTVPAMASPEKINKPISEKGTLELCVNYSTLKTKAEKVATIKELDRRIQLSEKDHKNLKKKIVEPSDTMCGMYMILGKPIKEQAKRLSTMAYKAVHIYPNNYYVTRMGLVIKKLPRTKDSIPPELSVKRPKVQGPPVTFIAPGGQPMH